MFMSEFLSVFLDFPEVIALFHRTISANLTSQSGAPTTQGNAGVSMTQSQTLDARQTLHPQSLKLKP